MEAYVRSFEYWAMPIFICSYNVNLNQAFFINLWSIETQTPYHFITLILVASNTMHRPYLPPV